MALTRAQKLRDSVSLDDIAYKVAMEADLDNEIKKAQKEQKQLRDEIKQRLIDAGVTYGTVFGDPVVRYGAQDKIAVQSLISDNEELTEPFMREVTKLELDVAALRRHYPELVEQYRVHAWGREK